VRAGRAGRQFAAGAALVLVTAGSAWAGGSFLDRALAQQEPPPPPMTAYGLAQGATVGQDVVAFVNDGSTQTLCSEKTAVMLDSGNPVYAVNIVAEGQKPGCGTPERTVQFYFAPIPGAPGRIATPVVPWKQGIQNNYDLTAGPALDNVVMVAMVGTD
jgi:hypothetical protein